MRLRAIALICLSALAMFAQTDRGTLTGTISDPAGAVIPNAPVQIKNIDTGSVYQGASSATGNYTIAQLPAGNYSVSVTAPGFKTYNRTNVTLPVSTTLRVDINLEVGATTESVTITEAAPLLKTESGELSHNVETGRMNNLPVFQVGAGSTGLRNVYSSLNTIAGAEYRPDAAIRINGLPSNTQSLRIEGQDATNGLWNTQSLTQPSVDAVQEVSIQTSNFAAEFGQAGGGVINTTMRSGTNQWHGSAYDYFVNEALNANSAYLNSKNRVRRNDYGMSFGGPVRIPKIYNGTDKTFFFFNFEQFRENNVNNNTFRTVPTTDYRNGNFSAAVLRSVVDNNTGFTVVENGVYDPGTDRLVVDKNGVSQRVRDLFPNNTIPANRIDRIAAKLQSYMPNPINQNLINNYQTVFTNNRVSSVPSVKLDHNLTSKMKISGYFSRTMQFNPNADGLPYPITSAQGSDTKANTWRLNLDYTLTPTMLLHLGAGLLDYQNNEVVPAFDNLKELGLTGTNANFLPTIQGINSAGQGGYSQRIGTNTNLQVRNLKPTFNASVTWVKGNHTYKFGGEMFVDAFLNHNQTYASPWMTFVQGTSGLPFTQGAAISGPSVGTTTPVQNGVQAGFPYASFLLGGVDNGYISVIANTRLGKNAESFFAQDTWKVTRRFTLDYGLRYDFQTYYKEQYGRMPNVGGKTPNPTADGLPGGTIFEATCGAGSTPEKPVPCAFSHNYPYAFGPRIGAAYQVNSKTVIRAGFGVSYSRTAQNNFQSYAVAANTPYNRPTFGDPLYNMQNGIPVKVTFPNFDPGLLPDKGIPAGTLNYFDRNAGRPGRIAQWSIGVQRELMSNMIIEAAYVGNRGAWFQAGNLVDDNAISNDRLKAFGLDITNPADQALLKLPISAPQVAARGFTSPYTKFPTTQSLFQALRPFPEYTSMLRLWAPLGNSYYDALQLTLTKRYSHGFDFTSAFTYGKQQSIGAESDVFFFQAVSPVVNNIFDRKSNKYLSGYDQRWLYVLNGNYTTPSISSNKYLSVVARDWVVGGVFRWGQGTPLAIPTAQSGLAALNGRGTYANRVEGQPLFLQDLNCHCFDPSKTFALNPAAWKDPAPGTFGTTPVYLNDYRSQRRYTESASIARNFRLKRDSRYNLQIRAEFTNIFNRAYQPSPSAGNATAVQTCTVGTTATANNCLGGNYTKTAAGFGFMNTALGPASPPRNGTLVARFSF